MKLFKLANSIRLWLDDNRDPKNHIIQQEFGAKGDEVWVKTVAEAKTYVQQGNVSFISFDNDLGPGESGSDLATWIEEQAYHKTIPRIEWTVHSRNPIESRNIYMALRNADKFWANEKPRP